MLIATYRQMRYFTITTLGCKVNQYDGAVVGQRLRDAGWLPAPIGQRPDLVLVNTCCVTAAAFRKSRQALRRTVRDAFGATVFVMGCAAAARRADLLRLLRSLGVPDENILISGNQGDLSACLSCLAERKNAPTASTSDTREGLPGSERKEEAESRSRQNLRNLRKRLLEAGGRGTENMGPLRMFPDHQRAFVKVQDGCDAFCNYCIVPYVRPRVWSRREEEILAECRQLVAAGHREIVLCGVFLGAYGRNTAIRRRWDASAGALSRLVRAVSEIPGLWRVRLSSLEPLDLTDELLAVLREAPTAAPHLHLPLQSGSDRVLRRMNRQYRAADYRRAVERLHAALDRPAVTTDIIVGYPGETDEDFQQTLDLAREAAFSKIHIFPFSPMEHTGAWFQRGERPPSATVRRRIERLASLEAQLAEQYRRQFVGEILEGIVERGEAADGEVSRGGSSTPSRLRQAMTDRYLTVTFSPPPTTTDLTGQVIPFRITGADSSGLRGEAIPV